MRVLSRAIILALLLGAYATALAGDVYIWKDEQGGVHIGDKPPTGDRGAEKVRGSVDTKPRSAEGEIELFVTSWCPYCDQAIAYLKSKGLRFKVHDIEKDSKAKRRMSELSKGRGGVPFAMIHGTPITGFSPQSYEQALRGK